MESKDKEKEYRRSVWEIYRKEWETARPEKRIELNERMIHWQESMKSGLTAQQAYYQAMEEEVDYRAVEEPSDKQPAISAKPWMQKWPLIFLSVTLVASIVYGVIITGDRNALNSELERVQSVLTSTQLDLASTQLDLTSTQSDLDSTQSDLVSTQSELDSTIVKLRSTQLDLTSTQSDLDSTQSELDSTIVELSSTKHELSSTRTELSSTKQTLTSTQSDLVSTQSDLTSTQSELDKAKEKISLFQYTFGADVFAGRQPQGTGGGFVGSPTLRNNPTATNPSWRQLKSFLLSDPTDDETYSYTSFNCVSFAEMLHNNAEDAGIKAAFVGVSFQDSIIGHALNAFVTTDKGLVYVDCTGGDLTGILLEQLYGYTTEYDKIAYVVKGKEYGLASIGIASSPSYSYYEGIGGAERTGWVSSGVVESIEIYW